MVEIIREMAPIIESMPVIFPLNILSSPMDAMSGEQSNFWGNWTNSLWTEIYSGGKIYKDSPTPKLRIESSYCETQLPVLISWVALYSLVCLSVRRGDISFPLLTIYLHCIAFVHRLCPLYRRYTVSPLYNSTIFIIEAIAIIIHVCCMKIIHVQVGIVIFRVHHLPNFFVSQVIKPCFLTKLFAG